MPPAPEEQRRVGLEDPDNPALVDDASIAAQSVRGVAYLDPRQFGGRSLNRSAGLGEPLNVIVSALSSPEILTRKGLQGYLRSLDFDMECLGLHQGAPQSAWLDARGWQDELFLYREVYTPLDHLFGTCLESLVGGNHVRVWQQQGTGAWFLAASEEMNVRKHHMIVPDGYNLGRDKVVAQSQRRRDGVTSFLLKKYQTRVEYVTGLMEAGTEGVNHGIAVDGRTAVLTITIIGSEEKARIKEARAARKEAEREHDRIVRRITAADEPEAPATAPPRITSRAPRWLRRVRIGA